MGNPLYIHNPLYRYISSRNEKSIKKSNNTNIKNMENTKEKNYKNAIIALCGMLAMVSLIGLYYYSKLDDAEKENQELKQNQKPATDLYNESNKPCAGG